MSFQVIRFYAFGVNLNDPALQVMPYWLCRCLDAVDENEIQPLTEAGESGYVPEPIPAYEIEGYFKTLSQFYEVWTCSTNIKSIKEVNFMTFDTKHPLLPWFKVG